MTFTSPSRVTSALAVLLLTASPLLAQEQPQAPAVAQIEAPALQADLAAPSADAPPALPGAEAAAPQPVAPQALSADAPSVAAPAPVAPATEGAAPTTAGETPPPTVPSPAPQAAAPAEGDAIALNPIQAGPRHGGGDHARPHHGGPGPEENAGPGPQVKHGLSGDLSPMGMYQAADIVVKAVMLGLLFGTFVTLTILVYKFFEVALAKRAVRRALRVIRNSQTLAQAESALANRRDPAAFMTQAALDELRRSTGALDVAGNDGVKERTRSIVERTEAQAGRKLMLGTGILATIGSTAPFVGLFGTVWGIMNSFISIAQTQTTNLAVVAPGIAEALLATAIGLVAAIPAVIVYNHFARQIQGYRMLLADAGAGIERLLSRDLDFRKVSVE